LDSKGDTVLRVFHLEGRYGRNYKTHKVTVLSREKQKPVCRNLTPFVIVLEKIFESMLNLESKSVLFRPMIVIVQFILGPNFVAIESCVGLMVLVKRRIQKFWRRHSNELSLGAVHDL
jgi:hypothetical protein